MKPALFALAALTLPGISLAHPMGMYEYGSRSAAMGGGVSADVEDFSANYYNPAGLATGSHVRLDLGYFWSAHSLMANGRDTHVDPVHGVVGGLVVPGRLFGIPFAFGLALHLPDDRLSRSRSLPQQQPRWELYDNRVQILYIAANVAVQPFRWLRIGGGLGFVSSTRGALDIEGQINYLHAEQSQLSHVVNADLTSVRYPQFGVQIMPTRSLTFSAVYRGEYRITLDIDALVAGVIVVGDPNDPGAVRIPGSYHLRSVSTAVFSPQQAVLGAAWRPVDSLTVSADVTWMNWGAYPNPSAQLTVALDATIPPELAGVVSLPAPPPSQRVLPANFHDTFVARVGFEWRYGFGPHQLSIRGGYRYDPSPVPEQTGVTNFMDSNRHVFSAGLGFLLGGLQPILGKGLSLDVHGAVQLLESRTVRKDDPADPVGDYTLGGRVFTFGASLGVLF